MLIGYRRGQGSIILRVKILDSAATTGAGKTGLTNSSAGLIISTIADNEATATAYTQAASNIETITTLGTYAAPTASKCRFKEVDATNHKGIYEIQIADARFAVGNAKSLLISISGASGAAETDVVIPLRSLDPYDAVRAGLSALPNAAANAAGGLSTSTLGGLNLDTIANNVSNTLTDTAEMQPFVAAMHPIILNIERAAKAITHGVVDTGATTTTIQAKTLDPAAVAANQFQGLIMAFPKDTATAALRGQKTRISSNTDSGEFTVETLTTAPAEDDEFVIE